MWFKLMIEQEGVHPLEGGAFRLKSAATAAVACRSNRPSSSIPATGAGLPSRHGTTRDSSCGPEKSSRRSLSAPDRYTYTDLAIAPPREDEFEQLSLYHATTGGEAALARKALGDSIRDFRTPSRCGNAGDGRRMT